MPSANDPRSDHAGKMGETGDSARALRNDKHSEGKDASLADLQQDLNQLQRSIRLLIQDRLAGFLGRSMGSLNENQTLAESVHQMLDAYGLRVRCPQCGHPAILRVSPRGKTDGVFVFDHTIEGRRTFHGGSKSFPEVRLVSKPPRRKATKKRA